MRIFYHRDFDGMASAAFLAQALEDTRGETDVDWSGVNFDNRLDWDNFAAGLDFAIVDFHFHERARYWFDHHPTTFLKKAHEDGFENSDTHCFDPESPSCPPIIMKHACEKWGWSPPDHFQDLAHWSNVIDAAQFDSAKQALFGHEPALQVMRSMTCAPNYGYHDNVVKLMKEGSLANIAEHPLVAKCARRAERNRDNALENLPPNVLDQTPTALFADLRSRSIRRERFAPFYLYPEIQYAVTVLPTRAGVHITAASNPWNRPDGGPHLGRLLERYDGGGHFGVGGCNPPSDEIAMEWGQQIFEICAGLKPDPCQ